ncbi:MAG: CDP-glycerol glycerophosphotransferase family protein [Clostridia bacterium]|nr:CDP-glycerol glycerophosphotransferase family protein [Clostridia bacterium]
MEWLKKKLIHIFMYVCGIFPVNKNKVAILSYNGKGFGDNGKGIALALLRKKPDIDIVWVAVDREHCHLPDNIRFVQYCSLRYYWEMATAGAWIDNTRKGPEIIKRKQQYYVQTWHGMVALKRIEKDVEEQLSPIYVQRAQYDSSIADLFLSGCTFFTDLCKRAFWYTGEILESGSPRLDVMFQQNEETIRKVKATLGIEAHKKVLLYAPTFRADGNTDCYIQDYQQILRVLEEKTGEEWVAAVRLHSNVANKAGFITYTDKVYNATTISDLYELIPAADIVISDYSSLMFDAGLIGKTVFLYATDIEAYKADRGFYFELNKLPFMLAENYEELLHNLQVFDAASYRQRLQQFNDSIGYFEHGNASELVAERILLEMSK